MADNTSIFYKANHRAQREKWIGTVPVTQVQVKGIEQLHVNSLVNSEICVFKWISLEFAVHLFLAVKNKHKFKTHTQTEKQTDWSI